MVIPGLIIFVGLYLEWWEEIPNWGVSIPWYPVILIVMTLLISTSRIVILLDDADPVWLFRSSKWIHNLKLNGLWYSLLCTWLKQALLILIALPFLKHQPIWEMNQLASVFITIFAFSTIVILIQYFWRSTTIWWKNAIISSAMIIIFFVLAFIILIYSPFIHIIAALYSAIAIVMIVFYIRIPLSAQEQLEIENKSKFQFQKFLLSQSIELRNVSKRKKPLIFKQSKRLIKGQELTNIIQDLYFKSFFRDFQQLKIWLMLISVGSFALVQIPDYAPFAFLIFLAVIISSLAKLQWDQWRNQPYILYYLSIVENENLIRIKVRNLYILFSILIWLIIIGIKLFLFS